MVSFLLTLYFVLSALAFAIYAADKFAAKQGLWRVPETALHILSLLGGWPGAFVAQRVLHHKTRKFQFQFFFALTCVCNCLALVFFASLSGSA